MSLYFSIKRIDFKLDLLDFFGRFHNDSYDGINILLHPITDSFGDIFDFDFWNDGNDPVETEGRVYKYSRALGFDSEGHMLSAKLPGVWPMFKFLNSFEPMVWFSLFTALIMLSIIKSIENKSKISEVLDNFWIFFCFLFGNKFFEIEKSILKNVSNILWMFCTVVILSAFSGVLLAFFMKPLPKEVINSWDDLYLRKDVKITAFQLSFIYDYVENFYDKEDMAKDFAGRLVLVENVGENIMEENQDRIIEDLIKPETRQQYFPNSVSFIKVEFSI